MIPFYLSLNVYKEMIVYATKDEVIRHLDYQRSKQKKIGFVPTMGALHQGHISLVNRSILENDCTVVSIFVNPTQFGQGEDFEDYPRDLQQDSELAQQAGVDMIFAPTAAEMYPLGYATYVDVEGITETLCGASRPGHFRGVCTVVIKLFNVIQPQVAIFGNKDFQHRADL